MLSVTVVIIKCPLRIRDDSEHLVLAPREQYSTRPTRGQLSLLGRVMDTLGAVSRHASCTRL